MPKCDGCNKDFPDSFLKPYSKPVKPPQPMITERLCNDCLRERKNPKIPRRIPQLILDMTGHA